ncbi:MAG: hypothetical protein K9J81_02560 [Desulfohalobiaceae bacterium]|nr:hypothetical protein [Desulfohalobiaceae bacterium]
MSAQKGSEVPCPLCSKQFTARGIGRHLSCFFDGASFGSEELDMDAMIGHVLEPKQSISYIYDFGSSTELLITAKSQHQGKLKKKSGIDLLVRNPDPQILCKVCHKNVAEHVDSENMLFLCSECLNDAECEQELLLPVVNSPRCGICAYEGKKGVRLLSHKD